MNLDSASRGVLPLTIWRSTHGYGKLPALRHLTVVMLLHQVLTECDRARLVIDDVVHDTTKILDAWQPTNGADNFT
jgi:hypothetical protein